MIRTLLLAALLAGAPFAPAFAEDEEAAAGTADEAPAAEAAEGAGTGEDAGGGEAAAEASAETAEEGEAAADVELTGGEEGGDEETAAEEEPAPAPKPKPKPKPRPRPRPRPAPASPFEYRPIEDFERFTEGESPAPRPDSGPALSPSTGSGLSAAEALSGVEGPATVKRAGTDPRAQFAAQATAPGRTGARLLALRGIPASADASAWSLPRALDLKGWRGVSVWAKASQPGVELKLGAMGGGVVWRSAPVGADWTEVRLDFAEDPGRGTFDPGAITELVVAVAHDLATPVDVSLDDVAAWKTRAPAALRWGLNLAPPHGPYGWRLAWDTVNCAGRVAPPHGLALGFWSAPVPYQRWPVSATWRELPHGLLGALRLVLTCRAEPAFPALLVKIGLREERGERFAVVHPAPVREGPLAVELGAFVPDAAANLGLPAADADGRLVPEHVREWSLELIPATERSTRGTLFVRDAWAEGAAPKAAPPPKPRPRPKPKPKPKPAPAPVEEDVATEEDEAGSGDLELTE